MGGREEGTDMGTQCEKGRVELGVTLPPKSLQIVYIFLWFDFCFMCFWVSFFGLIHQHRKRGVVGGVRGWESGVWSMGNRDWAEKNGNP